jgi:hypothetical protein
VRGAHVCALVGVIHALCALVPSSEQQQLAAYELSYQDVAMQLAACLLNGRVGLRVKATAEGRVGLRDRCLLNGRGGFWVRLHAEGLGIGDGTSFVNIAMSAAWIKTGPHLFSPPHPCRFLPSHSLSPIWSPPAL